MYKTAQCHSVANESAFPPVIVSNNTRVDQVTEMYIIERIGNCKDSLNVSHGAVTQWPGIYYLALVSIKWGLVIFILCSALPHTRLHMLSLSAWYIFS